MSQKIFTEEQSFNQWWLWLLMLAALAGMTLSFVNKYEDSTDFLFTMVLGYGIVLLVILLLWRLRLKTQLNENGIFLNFWPLLIKQKHIKWNEIDKAEVIKYSPLMDYGGWGYRIRLGGKGRAVNVKIYSYICNCLYVKIVLQTYFSIDVMIQFYS
jgi:hypothetical protein